MEKVPEFGPVIHHTQLEYTPLIGVPEVTRTIQRPLFPILRTTTSENLVENVEIPFSSML
jgi:hypothetical protein